MPLFIMWWAIVGLVIPVMILILHYLKISQYVPDYLKILLWPSSILTLGIQGTSPPVAVLFIAISIALNVGLYSAIGALVWWLRHLAK